MSKQMIRVGRWASALSGKQRRLLRELAVRGFSTIETSPHGNYRGGLPGWGLPGEVEREMKAVGLNTDGICIQRDIHDIYYPNREGPRQKSQGKER